VAAASIVIAMAFLNHFDLIGILVNFGALTGFLILHVTVVFHFIVRKRSRAYIRHLVCPTVGFVILAYVLYYMDPSAWMLGVSWLVLGLIGYWVFVARFKTSRSTTLDPA
jgi:Ca2+/Na+ antiporter